MNWSRKKSVILSQVCVIVFAIMLLALDIGAYWFCAWFVGFRNMQRWSGIVMMITVYAVSVFAWLCLYMLWKLLANIKKSEVFVRENVLYLRVVSWCCTAVGFICLLNTLYYYPYIFIAIAAGFMALIVRIVKNVFHEAIGMKSELDLTI